MAGLAGTVPVAVAAAAAAVVYFRAGPHPPERPRGSQEAANVPVELTQGQLIGGRLEILRTLGSGGMGSVYLVRDWTAAKERALKIIHADLRDRPDILVRFRREAEALTRLRHDAIVEVVESGSLEEQGLYLVMEYLEGVDLYRLVRFGGPRPLADALTVLIQLAGGLAYAHEAGVLHRDLKPSNILLAQGDVRRAKIIDFGLAKLIGADASTQITAEGQLVGTPTYMSPEQCASRDVGPPSDVYALAGLAYFMLTSQPVFGSLEFAALVNAHRHVPPPPLRERLASAPAVLEALLLECLDKDPARRPTAAEARSRLIDIVYEVHPTHTTLVDEVEPTGAETAVDTTLALATVLWPDDLSSAAGRPTDERDLRVLQALRNQITAQVQAVARLTRAQSPAVAAPLARIERLEEATANLELEVALLDSSIAEQPGVVDDGVLERRRQHYADKARELMRAARLEHRDLLRALENLRLSLSDPVVLQRFRDLDGLLDQAEAHLSRSAGVAP